MNEKSHVSLEQHVCLVCGSAFETGSVLLDRGLRASMERHTRTGWGLCPEHRKFADDGFVALIECDPERSALATNAERLKPEHAYRTGHVAHLRREVFAKLFDVPLESCQDCVFVEVGLIDQLESLLKREAT